MASLVKQVSRNASALARLARVSGAGDDVEEGIRAPILAAEETSTGRPALSMESDPSPDTPSKDAQQRKGRMLWFLHQGWNFAKHQWQKLLILAVLAVLIAVVSTHGLGGMLTWFERQNSWVAWIEFTGLYCAVVALYLPGIVFIVGAGYLFKFWKGLLAVWIGGGVGQTLAFLLARYLFRDSVTVWLKSKTRKWELIDRAMENEGWKLLFLLRLSPIMPYNVLNITMATTKIPLWSFSLTSLFGIVPECALLCYLGSFADSMQKVISGETGLHGGSNHAVVGFALALGIVSVIWATIFVRRALREAEEQIRQGTEMPVEQAEGVPVVRPSMHTVARDMGSTGTSWRVSPRASRISSRQASHEGDQGLLGEGDVPRGPLLRGTSRSNSPIPLAGVTLPALNWKLTDAKAG